MSDGIDMASIAERVGKTLARRQPAMDEIRRITDLMRWSGYDEKALHEWTWHAVLVIGYLDEAGLLNTERIDNDP